MDVALLYKDADKLWFVAKGILERLVIPERLFTSAVELNRDLCIGFTQSDTIRRVSSELK